MSLQNLFRSQKFLGIVLILVFVVIAQGYTATDIILKRRASDATGKVSGYSIEKIEYILMPGDPSRLDGLILKFTGTSCCDAITNVQVRMDAGTNWIACKGGNPNTWICNFEVPYKPGISSITNLQVEINNRISWYEKFVYSILSFFK
ncbi:MAG: hypothetical protein MUO42_03660 [Anaerolineaceae bacterium]|nr:hypothetical protein [Anaerolineaceae bacterium]